MIELQWSTVYPDQSVKLRCTTTTGVVTTHLAVVRPHTHGTWH